MARIQAIINSGDKIMSHGEDDLIRNTKLAERYIYDALMQIFKNVDISNGKLSSTPKAEDFLASLDARIFQALAGSGYKNSVNEFMSNYDQISENVISLHSALKNGNIPPSAVNPIKRLEVSKTLANLTEQGMYKDFINPVRQGLYRNILFGATVEETEKLITEYVVSKPLTDSKLVKYVGQVAADSLRQYDGSLNQSVKNNLGLNGIQYAGSLIRDSRAQCIKWVGMAQLSDEQLQEEIDFALNGGSYFVAGKYKKCSGMIPGTTPSTFLINRGGYRCRHRAFPIRLVK
jgi:hypothetical protein